MYMSDLSKTIEIRLIDTNNGCGWEEEFFEAGGLETIYDSEHGKLVYIVPDVDYCIEYVDEMMRGVGDFVDYGPETHTEVVIFEQDWNPVSDDEEE